MTIGLDVDGPSSNGGYLDNQLYRGALRWNQLYPKPSLSKMVDLKSAEPRFAPGINPARRW